MPTMVNRSSTIAAGGTAQSLMAAKDYPANRNGFWIQNLSAGDLWIYELGTATADSPSIKIAAGGFFTMVGVDCPDSAISIIGATTGQKFAAREW